MGFGPSLLVNSVGFDDVRALIERVAAIIDQPKASWLWIYELNDLPAPVYKAMYPMGFHIVAAYLEQNQINPIDALHIPWREFWNSFVEVGR